MDSPVLRYQIVPLVGLSFVLAGTRVLRLARPVVELVAAGIWCIATAAFGATQPLFSTVQALGSGVTDGLAGLSLASSASMAAVAVWAVLSVRGHTAPEASARLLQGLGFGVLGVYLARVAGLLYLSTRTVLSGGLYRSIAEAELLPRTFAFVGSLLVTGAVLSVAPEVRRRRTRG
jgi:hypothetical protein